MFTVILIILLVFIWLFLYSACKISGEISRKEEENYYEKISQKE